MAMESKRTEGHQEDKWQNRMRIFMDVSTFIGGVLIGFGFGELVTGNPMKAMYYLFAIALIQLVRSGSRV